MPPDVRRNIGFRLDSLQENLAGDVKKLSGKVQLYRLRVGNHRILFRLAGNLIEFILVPD